MSVHLEVFVSKNTLSAVNHVLCLIGKILKIRLPSSLIMLCVCVFSACYFGGRCSVNWLQILCKLHVGIGKVKAASDCIP